MSLADLTLERAVELLAERTISAAQLLDDVLERLHATDPVVRAYTTIMDDHARRAAAELDRRSSDRELGPLHGIPLALKDLIATADAPTAGGSDALAGYMHPEDAEVVRLLRNAGAVIIGKAVTHEFAYGLNTPPTRNAWDTSRYPGGSSAGSGVSVAVGSALGSLGTDTGGSGRVPAALNGVTGLKPTFGTVSTAGVIGMSSSMDAVTPIARTARGCQRILDVIRRDQSASPDTEKTPTATSRARLRLGLDPDIHFGSRVHPKVAATSRRALHELEDLGHEIVPINLPEAEEAVELGSLIVMVDTSNYHRELLRTRGSRYTRETRIMLQAGELLPGSAYVEAQRHRRRLQLSVCRTFREYQLDAVAMPTHPIPAIQIDQLCNPLTSEQQEGFARTLDHTILANLLGLPAISFHIGLADRLPVGLQLMGEPFADDRLLDVVSEYQDLTTHSSERPRCVEHLINSNQESSTVARHS